ncbi:hypothetical protein SCOCK_500048 [Actinacidiphila cocklensis]|uniref:Uncharacterized protein n=1 Tax=Actinacidiphila cocklensis TaxID=887465 RepID=A0A9W4DXJ2_9ACTN|nr:hypothetical protein SCOCK_500048 [Actinacidiphila cocklensis]
MATPKLPQPTAGHVIACRIILKECMMGTCKDRADGLYRAVRPRSSPGREMRSHRIVTSPTPPAA